MNNYSVEVKPSARKELESLPDNVLVRVLQKIDSLRNAPRPAGCKKLKGYKDHRRPGSVMALARLGKALQVQIEDLITNPNG